MQKKIPATLLTIHPHPVTLKWHPGFGLEQQRYWPLPRTIIGRQVLGQGFRFRIAGLSSAPRAFSPVGRMRMPVAARPAQQLAAVASQVFFQSAACCGTPEPGSGTRDPGPLLREKLSQKTISPKNRTSFQLPYHRPERKICHVQQRVCFTIYPFIYLFVHTYIYRHMLRPPPPPFRRFHVGVQIYRLATGISEMQK